MDSVVLVATWLFLVTHIDTLVVLVAFCADDNYRPLEVLIGHYAGFGSGLLAAVVVSALAGVFLQQWTFLLGLVPLTLGVWGLARRHPASDIDHGRPVPAATGRIGVVTAAGIGLSGENLALFIPFFADLSPTELTFVLVFYFIGAGVLFLAALLLGRVAAVTVLPEWIDRWLIPTVLLVVGVYVLVTGLVVG